MIFGYLFLKFQKKRSQKILGIARKKTRTDLESALNSAQSYETIFTIFVLFF